MKSYSAKENLSEVLEVFRDLAIELKANIFIDRTSSDASSLDRPSRGWLDLGRRRAGTLVLLAGIQELLVKGGSRWEVVRAWVFSSAYQVLRRDPVCDMAAKVMCRMRSSRRRSPPM